MFNRFIVATDLSSASFALVCCLGGLKKFGAKQCLLLQCISLQEAASTALSYTTENLKVPLREQKELLEKQGFAVEARTVPGFAKQEINRVAAEEDYSLIVVGSQGQSLIGETLLGGVASAVINTARKPVLVMPIKVKPGEENACHVKRSVFSAHVLFPTDFSMNADHAFSYIEKMSVAGTRRITLMHVQDKALIEAHLGHLLEEFNQIDRDRLEKLKDAIEQKSAAEVDIELCYGSPFTEINRVINERDVQLVVMGSQGRGFVKELFLGSVGRNIARHSDAPVLLIPAKGR